MALSIMENEVAKIFEDELAQISDDELRRKVVAVNVRALNQGGWKPEDMKRIPFTLLIENLEHSYVDHVKIVTRLSIMAANELIDNNIPIDMDSLIAGALLHDVAKLVEYADVDGKIVKSETGAKIRHPVYGMHLALAEGISVDIAQMIYQHSWEGDRGPKRSPEGHILHHCDFIMFESLRARLEGL